MNDGNSDATEFIPKEKSRSPARPEEVLPDTLQLMPINNRPFFPVMVQPLVVEQVPWAESLKLVTNTAHKLMALSLANTEDEGVPGPDKICKMGTVVRIHRVLETGSKLQFLAQGLCRFRIQEWLSQKPPYMVRVDYPEALTQKNVPGKEARDSAGSSTRTPEIRAYASSLINVIKELMALNPLYNEELKQYLNYFNPNDPSPLADFAAAITSADAKDLQDILETIPLLPRMEKVLMLINKELEVVRLQAKIAEKTQEQLNDQQREFFLRQQLKVIQKELGIVKDDRESDIDKFTARLEPLIVPEEVQTRVDDELEKLQILEPSSAEYGVTRNYLDWITAVPWGLMSKDRLDLKHARAILDRDHEGLDDVKQRIIEFLAVGVYRGEISGSILLLVGPPGVGKTSIGKSIADALGRQFFRFSLGGMRDEAEIKGHRRTYIGAMPGKLVQALKDVKVYNPVIMLDEIDKIGHSYRGDPASALLEVLDPEQNSEFLDHYLDLRVDLSNVLFICTANHIDTIPMALQDRMETIRLAGYLTMEKLAIAKKHLWKRQLKRAGLSSSKLKISDAGLKMIIEGYARDAGVRSLDKLLGRIVRRAVVKLLAGGNNKKRISITKQNIEENLGAPLFRKQKPRSEIGVVNGLAWTMLGGTTLVVEATKAYMDKRGFKQTGQLGNVMQESSHIAYSFVTANLAQLGGEAGYFDQAVIHLHVPEGATPKDGPSAGITMATALLSLARGHAIKPDIAMTGELTLTGRVLPVGGIKEKIVAAKRAGLSQLILPADNQRDYDELPEYLKRELNPHFVADYTAVAAICFA